MQVTKRDGTLEEFDLDKTRKVIAWACDGLNINSLELESHIDIMFKDLVKTQDIQENLISHSLSLVDLDHYDWLKVAANLRIMTKYKIYRDISFTDFVKLKLEKNEYHSKLKEFTDNELNEAFTWIDQERDKIYDYAGANTLVSKFLDKDEPLQYLYLSSALVIAGRDLTLAKELYDAFSLKKISLPTPMLSGVRKSSSNLASCFIGLMGDSLDDIFECLHKIAKISKNGGGVGLYIGDIRCNGSYIRGYKGAAGGITGWTKLINDVGTAVDQIGRRSGAITVAFPVWHCDLEDFLNLQTEHGDPRKKCHDIFPQLVCSDEFFRRVEADENWYCFDPYEVRTTLGLDLSDTNNYNKIVNAKDTLEFVKEYKARSILKEIIKVIVETGMPYITYIDTINRANPNSHDGRILCVNLCVESFSLINDKNWHTCSLASLNLANIEESELEKYTKLSIRMLDNVLDICEYPIVESKNHVENYRTVGLGAMGFADYLAKNGHTYESAYQNKFISNTFEKICYYSIQESIELSKERGPFKKFKNSKWYGGEKIDSYLMNSEIFSINDWDIIQGDINKYGIRNSQLMSPAPNTTSSLIQGCVSGILPPFNLLHIDDSSNGNIAIMPPLLSKYPLRYKAYKNYNMMDMIDYVAEMQKWVDTGISFEALFDLSKTDQDGNPLITAKYIRDYIMKSWKSGIKANYYWRYITKNNEETNKEDSCVSCSG